jgi:hypothetical protein
VALAERYRDYFPQFQRPVIEDAVVMPKGQATVGCTGGLRWGIAQVAKISTKAQMDSERIVSTSSPGSMNRASRIGFYNRSIINYKDL